MSDEQRRIEESSYVFIDDPRKSSLMSSDRFDAATVQEILSLVDEISVFTYRQLARGRKARNKWMHELMPVNSLDVEAALTRWRP